MQKREIHLKPEERDRLIALVSKGHHQANEIKRAYILLHSNDGLTDEAIGKLLFCSEDSVRRARIRYLNEGLEVALADQPRPGREPSLSAQQEAYLIALACSEPPSGYERWTLELLTQRMIDDEQVETVSPETVRLTLKKTNSNLGW
jgi:transposase